MIPRRERMAQRADKWWASVWLRQMCMVQPVKWVSDPDMKQFTTEDI